jgi:hypothetical protein
MPAKDLSFLCRSSRIRGLVYFRSLQLMENQGFDQSAWPLQRASVACMFEKGSRSGWTRAETGGEFFLKVFLHPVGEQVMRFFRWKVFQKAVRHGRVEEFLGLGGKAVGAATSRKPCRRLVRCW